MAHLGPRADNSLMRRRSQSYHFPRATNKKIKFPAEGPLSHAGHCRISLRLEGSLALCSSFKFKLLSSPIQLARRFGLLITVAVNCLFADFQVNSHGTFESAPAASHYYRGNHDSEGADSDRDLAGGLGFQVNTIQWHLPS